MLFIETCDFVLPISRRAAERSVLHGGAEARFHFTISLVHCRVSRPRSTLELRRRPCLGGETCQGMFAYSATFALSSALFHEVYESRESCFGLAVLVGEPHGIDRKGMQRWIIEISEYAIIDHPEARR